MPCCSVPRPRGPQDAWSDIDIALCVEDEHRADVVLDWTNEMYAEHGAVHTVSQINPSAFRQVATFRVGIGADAIVFGDRSLWIANITDETVSRIDPATGTVATIALAGARPE